MEKIANIYGYPNVGCMLGTAYQVLIGELGKTLSEAGLQISAPEYLILRSLYYRDGMQICELSDMVGKDKGAVSRSVKGLAEKGFVAAQHISHKCLKVFVTESGRRIEPEIMKVALRRHKALESILTADQMQIFFSALQKIIKLK